MGKTNPRLECNIYRWGTNPESGLLRPKEKIGLPVKRRVRKEGGVPFTTISEER